MILAGDELAHGLLVLRAQFGAAMAAGVVKAGNRAARILEQDQVLARQAQAPDGHRRKIGKAPSIDPVPRPDLLQFNFMMICVEVIMRWKRLRTMVEKR